jgi:hypothetical protein
MSEQALSNDPKNLRKQLLTIAGALVMGKLLFLAATSIAPPPYHIEELSLPIAELASALIAITLIALGMSVFRKRVSSIALEPTFEAKVIKYRVAFILRMFLVYLAGFISLIAFFISRETFYLGVLFSEMAIQLYLAIKASNEATIRIALEGT